MNIYTITLFFAAIISAELQSADAQLLSTKREPQLRAKQSSEEASATAIIATPPKSDAINYMRSSSKQPPGKSAKSLKSGKSLKSVKSLKAGKSGKSLKAGKKVINFDDIIITQPDGVDLIPRDYRGFSSYTCSCGVLRVVNRDVLKIAGALLNENNHTNPIGEASPIKTGTVSPENSMVFVSFPTQDGKWGAKFGWKSSTPFSLISFYLNPVYQDGVALTIRAFRDSLPVGEEYTTTLGHPIDDKKSLISLADEQQFKDINRFEVEAIGGTILSDSLFGPCLGLFSTPEECAGFIAYQGFPILVIDDITVTGDGITEYNPTAEMSDYAEQGETDEQVFGGWYAYHGSSKEEEV